MIRGFSVGVTMRDTLRRELASGLLLSTAIAAAFVPIALVGWGEPHLALGVGLALLAASLDRYVAVLQGQTALSYLEP